MSYCYYRRAFLMPIVLVVVMTISLAVSLFAEQMLAEYRATHLMTAQLQASNAAQSGVIYLQTMADRLRKDGQTLDRLSNLERHHSTTKNAYHHYLQSGSDLSFAIASARSRDAIVHGLRNESGKINLYGLPHDPSQAPLVRQRLMALPNMTPYIADAIMDWVDSDQYVRPLGAERSWYSDSGAMPQPSDVPIGRLAELLRVRGVTLELLFGEDTNQNGWLDANEDDGDTTLPYDNADGRLEGGWSDYLTVIGQETNYRDEQQLKIDVNQSNLVKLYDQLLPLFGPAGTTYIVALRLEGPMQRGDVLAETAEAQLAERQRTAQERLLLQLSSKAVADRKRSDVVRNGLELGRQPAYRIRSMVDLIDQDVRTLIDGQQQLLKSPWGIANLDAAISALERSLTITSEPVIRSRVNLYHASLPVLRSVPGIDATQAAAIVAGRSRIGLSRSGETASIAWLLDEGTFTLEQLRVVAPHLTTGGNVFAGTAIGITPIYSSAQRQKQSLCAGVHFVLDSSLDGSRVVACHDSMPFMLPLLEKPKQ